jgi:hypothetical protein
MWVMLLWALTLPGHELAVYSFLVNGSVAEVAPRLASIPDGEQAASVKHQEVHVFVDANTAPSIVLVSLQAVKHLPQRFVFVPVADDPSHYTLSGTGAKLLARLLSVDILPNAP